MAESMQAAVIVEPGRAELWELTRPRAHSDEVLVRVTATGVCTLERRIFQGQQPGIPLPVLAGHEVAGVVESAPEATGLRPGDPVALDLVFRCGECYYCTRGLDHRCVRIYSEGLSWDGVAMVGGGFGQWLSVAPAKVFRAPKGVSPRVTALAEPVANVIHSLNKARLDFGDHVAVIGAGTMGCLHVLLAQLMGCRVLVSDVDERRLAFVRDEFGVEDVVSPERVRPGDVAKAFSEGRGVNAVFVTAPSRQAGQDALSMVGPCATVVLYASTHPSATLDVDWNHIHYNEIRLDGTEARTREDFRQAVVLLDRLNLEPLASKEIPLTEVPEELGRGVPTGETQRVIVNMEL